MFHKPIKFNATSEDLLRHEINELAIEAQSLNDKRDVLIGRAVAMETKGMDYSEHKAYSLGIRWYSCKSFENFKQGYREATGTTSTATAVVGEATNPQAGR